MSYRNVLPGILTTAVTAALITISCHLFDPDKNQNSNGDDNNTSDTSVTHFIHIFDKFMRFLKAGKTMQG